jgi:hypothetical protein
MMFILFTAAGLIILGFSSNRNPAGPSVRLSHSDPLRTTNDGPRLIQPLLLDSFDVADPGGTIIWSTQIPALRFLCEHEPQGASCADLKPIYVELARRYPEIYDGHTFHDWGQLLVDLDVLRVEEKRIHITAAGRSLLHTVVAARLRETHQVAPQ